MGWVDIASASITFVVTFGVIFFGTWIVGKILKEENNARRSAKAAALWTVVVVVGTLAITYSGLSLIASGNYSTGTWMIKIWLGAITFGYIAVAKYVYGTTWKRALAVWCGVIVIAMILARILAPLYYLFALSAADSLRNTAYNTTTSIHSGMNKIAEKQNRIFQELNTI